MSSFIGKVYQTVWQPIFWPISYSNAPICICTSTALQKPKSWNMLTDKGIIVKEWAASKGWQWLGKAESWDLLASIWSRNRAACPQLPSGWHLWPWQECIEYHLQGECLSQAHVRPKGAAGSPCIVSSHLDQIFLAYFWRKYIWRTWIQLTALITHMYIDRTPIKYFIIDSCQHTHWIAWDCQS